MQVKAVLLSRQTTQHSAVHCMSTLDFCMRSTLEQTNKNIFHQGLGLGALCWLHGGRILLHEGCVFLVNQVGFGTHPAQVGQGPCGPMVPRPMCRSLNIIHRTSCRSSGVRFFGELWELWESFRPTKQVYTGLSCLREFSQRPHWCIPFPECQKNHSCF